jgi:phosphate:Na+ symporter
MFNVVGLIVISFILIFASQPIIDAIMGISGANNFKRFVANADTFFKLFQCIILLPFSNALVKLSRKVIHAKGNEEHDENEMVLKYIGSAGSPTASTAVVEIVQEIERMSGMVRENLQSSMKALLKIDKSEADAIYKREKYIDYLSHRITEYMVKANQYDIPLKDRERLGGLFHVVIDIERIGDHAINIMDDAIKEKSNKISFSEEGRQEITDMYNKVIEIYDKAVQIFTTMDKTCFDEINRLEDMIDQMQIECQEGHVRRMSAEECSIEAGLIFTDLVIGLERIADHATNIAYSILPEKQ